VNGLPCSDTHLSESSAKLSLPQFPRAWTLKDASCVLILLPLGWHNIEQSNPGFTTALTLGVLAGLLMMLDC
jgi:hypothetical protein